MKVFEVLQERNKEYTIAIDIDGVLADFSGRVKEITGKTPEQLEDKEMWNAIGRYTKYTEPFFENLNVLPDAYQLVEFIDQHFSKYFILSATGPDKGVSMQKIQWVKKTISPYIPVITVERSLEKAKYATEKSILIDDRENSTMPWSAAGGISVLHTSATNSINKIKNITGV